MKITAVCTCGKTYQAKAELAGRRVRCRACGHPFLIPAATQTAAADAPVEAELVPQAARVTTTQFQPTPAQQTRAPEPFMATPQGKQNSPYSYDKLPTPKPPRARSAGGVMLTLFVLASVVMLPLLCIGGGVVMLIFGVANSDQTSTAQARQVRSSNSSPNPRNTYSQPRVPTTPQLPKYEPPKYEPPKMPTYEPPEFNTPTFESPEFDIPSTVPSRTSELENPFETLTVPNQPQVSDEDRKKRIFADWQRTIGRQQERQDEMLERFPASSRARIRESYQRARKTQTEFFCQRNDITESQCQAIIAEGRAKNWPTR